MCVSRCAEEGEGEVRWGTGRGVGGGDEEDDYRQASICAKVVCRRGRGEERCGTGEGGGWRGGGRLPAGIDMRLSGVQIHTFVHLAILLPIWLRGLGIRFGS